MKSPTLIIVQFSLLGGIILNTGNSLFSIKSLLLLLPAILLAVWSIIAMRKSRFRISPTPAPDATLVISGPYQLIRHPMYSSILLLVIGLLVIHYNTAQLLAALLLALVLLVKSKWEEIMLINKFPEYKAYMLHTKSIIPYIL